MSAAFAFVVFFWFLMVLVLPDVLRDDAGGRPSNLTLWSVAFISTLALYVSAIAHELGHSLVARARKISVDRITVSFFAGHADISQDHQRPLDEAFISIAGPTVSLLIACAAAAGLAATWVASAGPGRGLEVVHDVLLGRLIPNQSPLGLFLWGVFLWNAWLAIYNLLPVPPLDGGRSLRGLLRHLRGDEMWATNASVAVGRGFAMLLASISVATLVFSFDFSRAANSLLPVWIPTDGRIAILGLFLAWLLNNGARSFQRSAVIQQRLAGVTVGRVMTHDPQRVPPWTSLEDIAANQMRGDRARAVAIVRGDDMLVGLVAYSDVEKVPAKDRPGRTAGEIMTAVANLITVSPDDPVDVAIRHMAQRHLNQLPVVEEGKLVGMVDRHSIIELTEPTALRF